jgi:hypothetical protein
MCTPRATLSDLEITPSELGVLTTPPEVGEVSAGPGVVIDNHVLWFLGTRSDSPFQGRQVVVSVDPANLQMRPPRLDDRTGVRLLFPDAPVDSAVGTAPTAAWLTADGNHVQYFYSRFYIFAATGAGLAQSTPQSPSAEVLSDQDTLFPKLPAADGGTGEPFRVVSVAATMPNAGVVYAYICQSKPDVSAETDGSGAHYQPCRLGRVSAELASAGANYRFWDGTQWQSDFERSAPVMDHVASGLTVQHNAYLDRFLAVHSSANNTLVFKVSTNPEGPFQELGSVETVKGSGALPYSFGARELIGLRQDCDRTLYVSYVVPTQDGSDANVTHQQTQIMRVDLK